VDFIHKSTHDNIVPDVLDEYENFEAMKTIQILWLMFAGERNFVMQGKGRVYLLSQSTKASR
jgi:hypothetical protein